MLFKSLIASFAAAQLVAGHGAIVKAVGDMGGQGTAIGIDDSTPRDGSRREPFQADSTRFKNQNVDACGETLGGGANEAETGVAKVVESSKGMPMVSAGGMIMMTLHQVNGDGAGPYKCMIDASGTGTGGWKMMDVVTNVPGKNSRSKAKAQDFPLTAKIAADQTCTGSMAGMDNVCMVRCNNAANAGPFGGCVPIMMMAGATGAAAGNTTTPDAAGKAGKAAAGATTPDADGKADASAPSPAVDATSPTATAAKKYVS